MGKTFKTLDNEVLQVDDYNAVDVDEDIIDGKVSGYYAIDEFETKKAISKEVYEALEKIL